MCKYLAMATYVEGIEYIFKGARITGIWNSVSEVLGNLAHLNEISLLFSSKLQTFHIKKIAKNLTIYQIIFLKSFNFFFCLREQFYLEDCLSLKKGRERGRKKKGRNKKVTILKNMGWGHLIKNGKINIESTPNSYFFTYLLVPFLERKF